MNAKIKEDLFNKELEGCTFKPKINTDYNNSKEGVEIEDRSDRLQKLYRIGIQMLSSKKDKSKEEFDIETNGKECTFKPNIYKSEDIPFDLKVKNDIYNEKSYELQYNRLKNGRLERKIRDSVHERGEFPVKFFDQQINKHVTSKISKNKLVKDETQMGLNNTNSNPARNTNSLNSNSNLTNEENDIFRCDPDKKDLIPLLIIDVNIRPGVKKKIYVFDGDTSEVLAEKFASEHGLDFETRSKLQVLIQSHISRLLMRIDEENQSVSEKSSTNHY